jgi:hypothetical protein
LACSSGGPTSPDQTQAGPLFASKAVEVDDDPFAAKPCPSGYTIGNTSTGNPVDQNGNLLVCVKNGGNGGGGPKKH